MMNNLFSALGQLSTVHARCSTASGILLFKFTSLESRSKTLSNTVRCGAYNSSTEDFTYINRPHLAQQAPSCHLSSTFLFGVSFLVTVF